MDATEKNIKIAKRILNIINEEKCTVQQFESISRFVNETIRMNQTVHLDVETIFEYLD